MSASNDAASEFRQVGHRLIDLLADYLDGVEELEVLPDASPSAFAQLLPEPLLRGEAPLDKGMDELEEKLLPNCTYVGHPGYFGFITLVLGRGSPRPPCGTSGRRTFRVTCPRR